MPWIFESRDLESYSEGARFGLPTDLDPMFERFDATQTSGVCDFERALNQLLGSWRRRREHSPAR